MTDKEQVQTPASSLSTDEQGTNMNDDQTTSQTAARPAKAAADKPRHKPKWREPRVTPNERPGDERRLDFKEVDLGLTPEQAIYEAERCLNCKKPLCVAGCPVSIDIPKFISEIREGKFFEALTTIKEKSMLPAVCGRVCPQENQCEGACILNGKSDPIAIGQLERFLGDRAVELGVYPVCARPNHRKVAVLGAGPAGLACAGELSRYGYHVSVFEANHRGGGVLTYGIPEFRLPQEVLETELSMLCDIDVHFEYNVVAGTLITAKELLEEEGFEAVFIAVGAGTPRMMGIPGENLPGVFCANEFLSRVNLMGAFEFPVFDTPVHRGHKVAVIGAGNVAMDAARTALRLGAEEVSLVYRRTRAEMPARLAEVHHAVEEGVRIMELSNPIEVIADPETQFAAGLRVQRMELGEPDESGRRRPVPIEGDIFEIEADTVITALGTNAGQLGAKIAPHVHTNKWGYLVCDEDGRTSDPRIWAGGDIVTGAATVILAMGAGKRAAQSIHEALSAQS